MSHNMPEVPQAQMVPLPNALGEHRLAGWGLFFPPLTSGQVQDHPWSSMSPTFI